MSWPYSTKTATVAMLRLALASWSTRSSERTGSAGGASAERISLWLRPRIARPSCARAVRDAV